MHALKALRTAWKSAFTAPDPPSTAYEYTPLPPGRHVRLLALTPSKSRSKPLVGSLHLVNLDSDPVYSALSYEWGDDEATEEIHLDGQVLSVRANLFAFLTVLRRQRRRQLYWADAISINQAANTERGHQVRMMGDIYSSAAEVLAWLGGVEGEADKVLKLVRSLDCGETHVRRHWGDPPVVDSIRYLFRLSYWDRLWIVQEVVLAKKLVLFVGPVAVKWSRVENHFDYLTALYREDYRSIRQMRAVKVLQHRSDYRQGTLKLSDLLKAHYSSQSTDTRDRVYGLLGLAHDYQESPGFEVDYNKDVHHLFKEVIAFCRVKEIELPKFTYLLQYSLRISRDFAPSIVSMAEDGFERQLEQNEMWYQQRCGESKRIDEVETPRFIRCAGIRLGRIVQADLPALLSLQAAWRKAERGIRPYAGSDNILLFEGLQKAHRALGAQMHGHWDSVTAWKVEGMRNIDNLTRDALGMRFVLIRWETLSTREWTLGLAPRHATDGNVVIKFYGYPTLFFADEQHDSPLLGPISVHQNCGILWDELEDACLDLVHLQAAECPEFTARSELDRPELDRPELDRPELDRPELDRSEPERSELLKKLIQKMQRFNMSISELQTTFS